MAVSEGQTDGKEDTKSASTIVKVLSSNERFALLQLNPTTGRKHQLRLVCSEILHAPIVGDFKYGYKGDKVDGHLLHCFELQFQVRQLRALFFSPLRFPLNLYGPLPPLQTWQKNGKLERIKVQAPIPDSIHNFTKKRGLDLSPMHQLLAKQSESTASSEP